MASLDKIQEHIRFSLDQLAARNAYHNFEDLCRQLARQRICGNILPATGPVGHGGDQGRDFESFRTFLCQDSSQSMFLALVSKQPLVFACSLQKNIEPKIRGDVARIMGCGYPVEGIHYFCVANIPIGARHALQEWSRTLHKVHLEIYDGLAIAELLSEYDVFWIAERYLGVPGEIYPHSSDNESDQLFDLACDDDGIDRFYRKRNE